MQLALGLIETKGLIGAIEAADAMVKAAKVKLISKEIVTGALVLVKIEGEVGAVKSAVDAGASAAQRVGQLVSQHIIPRPDDQIDDIIYVSDRPKKREEKKLRKTSAVKTPDDSGSLFDSGDEKEISGKADLVKKDVEDEIKEVTLTEKKPAVKIEKDEKVKTVKKKESKEKIPPVKKAAETKTADKKSIEDEEREDTNPITSGAYVPSEAYLSNLNVHELRKLARGFEGFPIKGRDISKANRGVLLEHFKKMK
ncbi:MAG: BMC domain-containing protein [Ignavibacteriae bacterium]|nr:BMC domain-containing protein [Ignavibacteriota bacterium]NOG97377.1 BMC domain-containing protein [Ignavibacteriota bacterium]